MLSMTRELKGILGGLVALAALAALACTPAATPTPTPTPSPTPTTSASPTPTPTRQAATPTPTPPTPTPTPTTRPSPTPTPLASPTPTATPAAALPNPKSPVDTVTLIVKDVGSGVGLNRAGAPDSLHYFGIGETFFMPIGNEFVNPMLAESFDLAPDLSKVTLHLRQGVQFHNGYGEMTAQDAAWSLNDANATVTPTSIHGQAGDFAALFGEAKALDTYTLEIPFTTFDVTWNSNYLNDAGQALSILSKGAYDANGEDWARENIIATGPYRVVQWAKDDRVVLEAVPNHWRKNPAVKNVHVLEIPEEATRVSMMMTGEADAGDIDLKDVGRLKEAGFQTTSAGGGFLVSIAFSGNLWETHHAITGQPIDFGGVYARPIPWISPPDKPDQMERARKVRWAMAMAIDREAIAETILEGLGFPEYIVSASVTLPQFQERWRIPYDPQQAERLLDEAGYPRGASGNRFQGVLYVQTETTPAEIADAIGGFWNAIGIPTDVLKHAYSIFRPSIVGRTNTIPWLAFFDEGTSNRPFDWPKGLQMSTVSRGGASAGFESPYIAERFLLAAKEPDIAKRIQINTELVDYEHHWMLIPGVVNIPFLITYNPRAIREWPMGQKLGPGMNDPEDIVPAR